MNMMKKTAIWMLALALFGALQACDDDDVKVPSQVQTAFAEKFPGATRVEWERRGSYLVADFHDAGYETDAWFDAAGVWYMTETEILFQSLPAAVQSAFEAGEYATWKVEHVEKVERRDMEPIYVIEVERGEAEFDLHYSHDGVLVRVVPDADNDRHHDDLLPQQLPQAVTDFIAAKYPGARILEAEPERDPLYVLEVEIIDGGRLREVRFDAADKWVHTKTEVRAAEVPDVVMAALRASQYAAWTIDEIDQYVAPEREWYRFELEQPGSERETEVDILSDGTLL